MTCNFHNEPMCGCSGCWAEMRRRIAELELELNTLDNVRSTAVAEERRAIVEMLHRERDAVLLSDAPPRNTAAVLMNLMGRIEQRGKEASDE